MEIQGGIPKGGGRSDLPQFHSLCPLVLAEWGQSRGSRERLEFLFEGVHKRTHLPLDSGGRRLRRNHEGR